MENHKEWHPNSSWVLLPKFKRSRVINESICKLRGLITFPSYTDIDFSRLQSSILVAETNLQQGRSVWPHYQEHNHVTMLPGAWSCDHATRSMIMWPCYQERDHVTMLPGAWSIYLHKTIYLKLQHYAAASKTMLPCCCKDGHVTNTHDHHMSLKAWFLDQIWLRCSWFYDIYQN